MLTSVVACFSPDRHSEPLGLDAQEFTTECLCTTTPIPHGISHKHRSYGVYLSSKVVAPLIIDSMAELGSVIIVGCCPYIPKMYRRHQLKSTTAYGAYSSSQDPTSSRSKVRSRFQTLDESPEHGDSDLRSSSDVHLEMHQYANGSEPKSSEEDVPTGTRISKLTHVTQTSEPV